MIPTGFSVCVSLCVLLPAVHLSVAQSCTKKSACSCESSQGLIDLTPLSGAGTGKFMDQPDTSGAWFYSWNPCNNFNEGPSGSACQGVAACQSDNTGENYYNLGEQSSAQFVDDPTSGLTLQYSYTSDIKRTAVVALTCDQGVEGSLAVLGEDPANQGHYLMVLSSKYACPSGGPGPGPGPGSTASISIGSVLVIIFVGVSFVYILAGIAFMVFIRKASGRDMVPNYDLWMGLFGLIKDGFLFTFTCGKRSGYAKV